MSGTVLITGSARGLGKELALVFAEHGYAVIVHDKKLGDLKGVKEEIAQKGAPCWAVAGDLRRARTLDALSKASKAHNLSVLINNVGVHCPGLPLEELDDSHINNLLLTNLLAPVKLACRIYPFFLQKNQGTIISINSILGLENRRFRTLYCASKWGLRGFSDTLRLEAQEHHIRILDVYPSRIKTRSEFEQGMRTQEVAEKIYKIYARTKKDKLILDDRPKKYAKH